MTNNLFDQRLNKNDYHNSQNWSGFTIVELLIVIVVIGILAAVTIVAYNGINQKAIGASLQSDLKNASTQLKLYQVDNGAYPTTNDCSTGVTPLPPAICLKSSQGNVFTFTSNSTISPQTFSLKATNNNQAYSITDNSTPVLASAMMCPTGYIVVPGSSTYGTAEFCTMKYEAKNVAGVATSQPAGSSWISIAQDSAIIASNSTCSGCHLITDAEYLTIAQNVLGVASNWSGGAVGSGFIYQGNSDGWPSFGNAADSNDANGYFNTGDVSPSNQRRTLTLNNGEVIWDLSGNVWEWTTGIKSNGQPGISTDSGKQWKEWAAATTTGSVLPNPFPVFGTPAAGGWTSANGIGKLYSDSKATGTVLGFIRGGATGYNLESGVLALMINYAPNVSGGTMTGFRVSK